jgi:hypothetical protein
VAEINRPYTAHDDSGTITDKKKKKEGTNVLDKGTVANWTPDAPDALDTSTDAELGYKRGLNKAAQCRNRFGKAQELRPLCPSHELVAPNELAIMSAIENGGPVCAGALIQCSAAGHGRAGGGSRSPGNPLDLCGPLVDFSHCMCLRSDGSTVSPPG